MQKVRTLLAFLCLAVLGAASSHADSVIGYFDLSCSANNCEPGGGGTPASTTAVGQIILTLNTNGTIAASLDLYNGLGIQDFGLNSTASISESGFSPTSESSAGQGDSFGNQFTGIGCASSDCGSTATWTILGDYTSVSQVLNGGSGRSSVDFFLFDSNDNEWGADAEPYTPASATPEPGSFLLLGTGALGLIGALRRRLVR
jgi:hypothetical protein